MHLESLTITNFRKFGETNNIINFVKPKPNSTEDVSIGSSSTLIIGQNNAGKTTIANALSFIYETTRRPKSSDFNFSYLKGLFDEYINKDDKKEGEITLPELSFCLKVHIDISEENDLDFINNISQFVPIDEQNKGLIEININYKVLEESIFRKEINTIIKDYKKNRSNVINKNSFQYRKNIKGKKRNITKTKQEIYAEYLSKFYNLIDGNDEKDIFSKNFYNSSGNKAEDFKLNNLIKIKEIKANRHLEKDVLSKVFKRIISKRLTSSGDGIKENFKGQIDNMNLEIKSYADSNKKDLSGVLESLRQDERFQLGLHGNVTEETILRDLIKYTFDEYGDCIPEDQFGLGYINLLNIVGEIVEYVDDYENGSHKSQINLLFIEEPEVFMHPQMQKSFIERIDGAIKKITDTKKNLYCQIIITTHSSHIVNSKIHSANSFDDINYITVKDNKAHCVNLEDASILNSIEENNSSKAEDKLSFLKKHIKYKVSELFFSDAVIFVEGYAEDTILPYYLENDKALNKKYISIFSISGAHTQVYLSLIKKLEVPCLVITDIDIKRTPEEKGETEKKTYKNVICLEGRETSNNILKKIFRKKSGSEKLSNNLEHHKDGNLYVSYQNNSIKEQYATSFEEAFILTNYSNDIAIKTFRDCKPKTYNRIVSMGGNDTKKSGRKKTDKEKLITKSFEFYCKLSIGEGKGHFANMLLYNLICNEGGEIPKLPKYISDGFEWLKEKLGESKKSAELSND